MSFSFAINRKHCRFCNMFVHTRCARARVCVCVMLGDGVDKFIQNQAVGCVCVWGGGGAGVVGERNPHCGQII